MGPGRRKGRQRKGGSGKGGSSKGGSSWGYSTKGGSRKGGGGARQQWSKQGTQELLGNGSRELIQQGTGSAPAGAEPPCSSPSPARSRVAPLQHAGRLLHSRLAGPTAAQTRAAMSSAAATAGPTADALSAAADRLPALEGRPRLAIAAAAAAEVTRRLRMVRSRPTEASCLVLFLETNWVVAGVMAFCQGRDGCRSGGHVPACPCSTRGAARC